MTVFQSGIYTGDVTHVRLRPVHHKLRYPVFSLLIDLDELELLNSKLKFFSQNRLNVLSIHDKDHGTTKGRSIREDIRQLLAQSGFNPQDWRVTMLCYPRVFGYVFNPITVYFCRGAADDIRIIIYEVNNTFGERQHYLAPVRRDESGICLHGCAKTMTVSPFNRCQGDYRFHLREPGEDVVISILYRDHNGPLLRAMFAGKRQPMSDGTLVRTLFSFPLLTFKVIAAIHFEALKLWLKGVPFIGRKRAALTRQRVIHSDLPKANP